MAVHSGRGAELENWFQNLSFIFLKPVYLNSQNVGVLRLYLLCNLNYSSFLISYFKRNFLVLV